MSQTRSKRMKKLMLLIIAAAIIVRVFVLATLPDSTLNDSIYHLLLVKGMSEGGLVSIQLPAFYAFSYFITGSYAIHFIKAVPVILSAAYLILLYLFLREVIPKRLLPAFAFGAVTSWTLIYGSVNYTGLFAGVLVLLCLLLFAKLLKTKGDIYLWGLALAIPLLFLSKLNGTLIAIVLLPMVVYGLVKTNFSKWQIIPFAAITVFLSYSWFLYNYLATGNLKYLLFNYGGLKHIAVEQVARVDIFTAAILSYLEFWNYPPITLDIYAGLFVILLLPVTFCIIYGARKMLQEKKWIYYMVLGAILINWAIPFKDVFLNANQLFDWGRYFIPSIALYSIPFVIGLSNLKGLVKKVVLLSFVFFVAYSLSYSAYFAYFFNGIHNQHIPLYNYATMLPQGVKIFSSNQDRQITFFSDREGSFLLGSRPFDFEIIEADTIHILLKLEGYDYLAITCYKEFWKEEAIEGFKNSELFKEIYADDCSKVYEVK